VVSSCASSWAVDNQRRSSVDARDVSSTQPMRGLIEGRTREPAYARSGSLSPADSASPSPEKRTSSFALDERRSEAKTRDTPPSFKRNPSRSGSRPPRESG